MANHKGFRELGPGDNPDPKRYILVKTKEGSHFRQKRGLVTPAVLNDTLQKSADSIKVCSPAAKRIAAVLWQHLRGLETGRSIARISGLLRKALRMNGKLDFSLFGDFEFQPYRPLDALLKAPYECQEKDGRIEVEIPIHKAGVKRLNPLVTGYYFDLVLLYGDPTKDGGLKVDNVTSSLYLYESNGGPCILSITLPQTGEPWMVMLKISSLEGNELAVHPRHYGMRVVMHSH